MIRRRLLISGRVQGVGFRWSCWREAEAVGATGSARNLADGRVEVVVEGSAETVAAIEQWCRVGPRGARVTNVESMDEPPVGDAEFRAF